MKYPKKCTVANFSIIVANVVCHPVATNSAAYNFHAEVAILSSYLNCDEPCAFVLLVLLD
jgi:hypothetical protein